MLAHTLYLLDPRVRREAEALAQRGVEVHVIGLTEAGATARSRPGDAIVNGVHIHRLPIKKKRGNTLRYLYEYFMTGFLGGLKLAALRFGGKLDVVHIHNMPDILILSALIPRLGGSKLVLDIHDPMPELSMSSQNRSSKSPVVWLLRMQEKISCKLADYVISVNESMKENLLAKGVPENKIFIVHNFPDQRVFPIRDAPVSWPRKKDGLSLLYCGTVTEHYDLASIVKAIARLEREIPIKLRVVGAGPTLDGIVDLARSLGVADSIERIGVIPLDRVHQEMREADIGISCQRRTVFGDLVFSTKIVEYLTQGLPVLTPRTYTVNKYLPDDSVFYFEPGSDASVADAIRFMWRNPPEVLRRLSRAKELLPYLSWQLERNRFLDFYSDLLNGERSRIRSQQSIELPIAPLLGIATDSTRRDLSTPALARAIEGKATRSQEATHLMPLSSGPTPAPIDYDLPLKQSLEALQRWVESHDYRAYEPFDGLSSYLRPLTFGNLFLDRILMQVVRQSPVNLRPLLGVKPLESTKGRGYMAWGYLALFELTGSAEYKERAAACLEWLIQNKSPLYPEHSWANHFDFASRSGGYSKHESIIVWTALIGHAFLDGYEILSEERYLEVAKSICKWILKLPREKTESGTCLSYLAKTVNSIHNSNMLGASVLARTAKYTGEQELRHVARKAMEYSCTRQSPDGSWRYGEGPEQGWIDNFHTGYNLDSLKCYIDCTGDQTFRRHLNLGFHYFKETFFDASGRPSYYHNRPYPIDIQCAAQAIETFANFADMHPDALPMALRVARWTIEHMQDSSGYFYYRRYPLMVARTPMLHWGQATMFRALALLRLKLHRHSQVREAAFESPEALSSQIASS
jgi:glycosyltransferase involved in cell wall biosynthesis